MAERLEPVILKQEPTYEDVEEMNWVLDVEDEGLPMMDEEEWQQSLSDGTTE